jgi:hypothetical protein
MTDLPTFEETFERQLFEAGENKMFYNNSYIIINELWLRNFHKLAQTEKPLHITTQRSENT